MNSEELKYEKPLLTNLGSITKHTLTAFSGSTLSGCSEDCEWTGGSGDVVRG